MKQRRNRGAIVIGTKVGADMGAQGKGLSRAHILRAVDASLARLQTDHIDLYQSHIDDATVPWEETPGPYSDLITKGKIRAIGASNHTMGG
jgi:aryl-alcohol dehydrogenase-like predicted oxidoreductase